MDKLRIVVEVTVPNIIKPDAIELANLVKQSVKQFVDNQHKGALTDPKLGKTYIAAELTKRDVLL